MGKMGPKIGVWSHFWKNTLLASVPSDSIAGSPSQTYIKC